MGSARSQPRNLWLALVPLFIGTFTGTVNNAIVNVPMAQILTSFDAPLSTGALVVVAFNLAFAVLMPLSGWLGDKVGRRRLFCFAMAVLALGGAGAALSPTLPVLIGFRVLQGAATAAVLPGVMSLIASMFDIDRRGRALGLWAAVNGAGQAAGPAVGGLLAGWIGWRAVFWPTVPMAMLALGLTLAIVPRDHGGHVPLEWRGAVLLTTAAGLSLGAASAIPTLGVGSPLVRSGFGLGVAAGIGFLAVERGRPGAFLPPGLLIECRYLRSSIAVIAQMFCLGATLLGVPLYLVREHGVTVAVAGILVLAMPLTMSVLAPLAGLATERLTPRTAMRWGLGVLLVGEALLAALLSANRRPDIWLVCALVVIGAGVAFVQTPGATGATQSQAGQRGAGLGLFNLFRFGGSALGASWVAAVADHQARWGLVFGVCTAVGVLGLAGTFLRRDTAMAILPGTARPTSEVSTGG